MRRVLTFVLLIAAPFAWAQSPEERGYLAERDRAIAALEAKYDVEEYKRASDALEVRLRRIIGAVAPPMGFAGIGHFSPDTLCCGVGEGKLDGIAFATSDDTDGSVIVTTESLLLRWLATRKMPAEPASALLSGDFYANAIVGDAAVTIFATLPIVTPAGATMAVAALALASQAGAFWPPRQIAVSVLRGGMAYVAFVEARPVPEPIAACEVVLQKFHDLADAAFADRKPEEAFRAQEEGEGAFVECWTGRVKDEATFPVLIRQAQSLANALAGQ